MLTLHDLWLWFTSAPLEEVMAALCFIAAVAAFATLAFPDPGERTPHRDRPTRGRDLT